MKRYDIRKNGLDARRRLTDDPFFLEISLMLTIVFSMKSHLVMLDVSSNYDWLTEIAQQVAFSALIVFSVSLLTFVCYSSYLIVSTYRYKVNKNPLFWIKEREVQLKLEKAFLEMNLINKKRYVSSFEIPSFRVNWLRDSNNIQVFVEILPSNAGKEEEIIDALNSAMNGNFEEYSVLKMMISDTGNWAEYLFYDTSMNRRVIAKQIEDLKPSTHYVYTLMDNLDLDIRQNAHMLIVGRTGSQKTTLAYSLLAQFFLDACEVKIIDPKNEFSVFSTFMESGSVITDSQEAIELLRNAVKKMNERHKSIARFSKKNDKIGATAADFNARPLVILVDELAALMASFTSKKERDEFMSLLTQLVQKGRSALISAVLLMQRPDSGKTIDGAIRDQLGFRVILGSSTLESRTMVLGSNWENVKANVKKGEGYYLLDGYTDQPQKFKVMDIFTYQIARPSLMKKAYELGKSQSTYSVYDFDENCW